MNRPARIDRPKKPTNVSLDSELVEQAKHLGINLSQSCEEGLRKGVSKALNDAWKQENHGEIEKWNDWVRENGMPYSEYRQS